MKNNITCNDVLIAYIQFNNMNGYYPTLEEVASMLSTSRQCVGRRIEKLVSNGKLTRVAPLRGYRPTGEAQ
jgi:hypothetical protein